MDAQEIMKSRKFKIAAGVVGVLLIALVSFASGVKVGLHKARFSYQWGQNYERNFMGFGRGNDGMRGGDRGNMMDGRRGGRMMDFPRDIEGRDFRNAHGLAGTIISITDNNIIIKDRDNKENTVSITDKTIIKDRMNDLKITDLKTNDQIVIMGTPNDQGVINADLIRVFGLNRPNEENANNSPGGTNTDSPNNTNSGSSN